MLFRSVRMALGAGSAQTMRLVLGRSMALVGAGALCGLVASVAATRALAGLLYEVSPLDPIVFALSNPVPEVRPEEAASYVRVMATGRSDYPNQINNVLAFPGIFRGALDVRALKITEEMKVAAAHGIASVVSDDELAEDYIVPSVFNRDVSQAVASAVATEAERSGIARGTATVSHIV